MTEQPVFPAFYLPNISYFRAIHKAGGATVCLEQCEHFVKQTYRTRTRIGTANGGLDLFIPIVHGRKEHVPMKDVRIAYDHKWQRLHWLSLQTAYRSSAYFEYYEDDFAPFYTQRFEFLFDYHVQLLEVSLRLLKLKRTITLTESYEKAYPVDVDLRQAIHPKKESIFADTKPYYQVFEEQTGFQKDLSIVDLIFNQGPQAKSFL